MEKPAIKNKIPTQAEKGKGKEIPEGLPDHKSGQDEKKDVPNDNPMEEYLAWVIFTSKGIRLGKAEEAFQDR